MGFSEALSCLIFIDFSGKSVTWMHLDKHLCLYMPLKVRLSSITMRLSQENRGVIYNLCVKCGHGVAAPARAQVHEGNMEKGALSSHCLNEGMLVEEQHVGM